MTVAHGCDAFAVRKYCTVALRQQTLPKPATGSLRRRPIETLPLKEEFEG
jgi:hypothetical protein